MNERPTPRYMTVSEVAEDLQLSTMTIYRLINAGTLAAVRIGKSYRIRVTDLDVYLKSQYVEGTGT